MSSNTIYRMGTANLYDNARLNVSQRQNQLTDLQENLTSGKRVVRPSDDPVAAAQAERAMTRINRIQTEQRALEVQRGAVAQAESTLGDAVGLVQEMRQLIVAAGNGGLKPEDRKTYANQLQSLREQLSEVVNRKDTNGMPLLGALGSQLTAFLGPLSGNPDYQFAGQPGQTASTGVTVPLTLDGHSALMFDPQRDGVYNAIGSTIPVDRTLTTSGITPTNPGLVTGNNYRIDFLGVGPGAQPNTTTAQYTITDTTVIPNVVSAPVTIPDYPSDKPMEVSVTGIPGLSFTIKGNPANGDSFTLKPSASLLSSLDSAIRDIGGAANNNAAAQAVGQALNNLDIGMERLHNMRGYAGELLNRADRITGDQTNRSIQLEGDRSRAEDLDMVKGISDFQNAQTGYEAALKSYAQVQRLTLFNFIN
ncbi:MAG: flagellar hook-associated protein FlgL [Comamonadaceae bacterium]|nr:flagellar hook-associated protein FlgL [Comamonadaceae bacterium]